MFKTFAIFSFILLIYLMFTINISSANIENFEEAKKLLMPLLKTLNLTIHLNHFYLR